MMMSHGGKRLGAGRPRKEDTKVLRIPISKLSTVHQLLAGSESFKLPLYSSKVRAGFPSPADDFIEDTLDLNQYLIKHPASTFIVRAEGDSMVGAGIYSGSLLLVDKSLEPKHGDIIVVALNGELTVKTLYKKNNKTQLHAANPDFLPININEAFETIVWGVVISIIQKLG